MVGLGVCEESSTPVLLLLLLLLLVVVLARLLSTQAEGPAELLRSANDRRPQEGLEWTRPC